MTKTPDRPQKPLVKPSVKQSSAKPPRRSSRDAADAHGDFYFDELMTPQPDATREFFRSRLTKPAKDGGK